MRACRFCDEKYIIMTRSHWFSPLDNAHVNSSYAALAPLEARGVAPHRASPTRFFCSGLYSVIVATMLAFSGVVAHADELSDATQLLRQKQHAQALDKVNQFLAAKPRDAQARFLKGLILADQNKIPEAVDIFTKLTQDYPELPEPYNNLAVLYASQGQYEKARQALEMSIRTHPSYATAYENLGDVYAKLASQAYDKALQLDSSNAAAKSKLSMVREMISSAARPSAQAAAARPAVVAAAPKVEPPAAPPAKPVPATPAANPAAVPAPAPKVAAAAAPAVAARDEQEEVIRAVRNWASAWSQQDVKRYLSHYADSFKAPNGQSRGEWEKVRRQRIGAPKRIEVSISSPKVTLSGNGAATVTFRQSYRSDRLNVSSNKTMVMTKSDGKWMINQELIGKERSGS